MKNTEKLYRVWYYFSHKANAYIITELESLLDDGDMLEHEMSFENKNDMFNWVDTFILEQRPNRPLHLNSIIWYEVR